ncbi:MAG: long-chain fatty acid--CoA ligase [Polyangiaceae bacterium]
MIHTAPHVPVRYVACDSTTVADMFRRRVELSANRQAYYEKQSGRWQSTTWRRFHDLAARAAKGFYDLGLEPGDRVAILGPTKSPWIIYDMAAQLAGLVSLGIYPKQPVEQIRYVLEHSDARVVLVDGPDEIDHVLEAVKDLDHLVAVIPWEASEFGRVKERDARVVSSESLVGEPLDDEALLAIQEAIDPEDTAILIYTSGTTGPPKGAMITHRNILTLLAGQDGALSMYEDDLSLNFLPMAHAAERVFGFYGRINAGIATAYASGVGKVLKELQEVRPTLFGSVPRLFEKAHGKIMSEIEKKPPVVQKIFAFARSVGLETVPYRVKGEPLPLGLSLRWALVDRLVYKKVRAFFGGRVRWFVTGAAPIAMNILEFFWGAGLSIFEVYGMTEATVVTHANLPGAVKLGTVGKVHGDMEHKIADDGEVLIRGPYVFKGYFKNDEATAKTVIDDWLYTGDIGRIDEEGFLSITDRKKHLIITAGGKNLAPANIENAIKNQDPVISQVHAHGDRRAYVSAIIAPSPVETLEWGVEQGLVTEAELEQHTRELMDNPAGRSESLNTLSAKVVVHEAYRKRVAEAVARGNEDLARVERVRRFTILERDFSQEHGELTPTMKLKRRAIEEKFSELFDRIYDEDGFAIEP